MQNQSLCIIALQLGDIDKPLKLIESWPTLMSRFCKDDTNETPHLYLRRNVFLAVSREKSVRRKNGNIYINNFIYRFLMELHCSIFILM